MECLLFIMVCDIEINPPHAFKNTFRFLLRIQNHQQLWLYSEFKSNLLDSVKLLIALPLVNLALA